MIRGINGLNMLQCSRLSQGGCECHSGGMYRYPVFPETFNVIHTCVGSVPEHFRVVRHLESSLILGYVH